MSDAPRSQPDSNSPRAAYDAEVSRLRLTPPPAARTRAEPKTDWTAREILAAQFPEPRYAIPGILVEGLTVLAGAPKAGKSWMAMNGGAAIGSGGRAFGRIAVEQGPVLYLALEDTARRLQKRLKMVLQDDPIPSDLHFNTEWPRLNRAGIEQLDDWVVAHPGTRLVIIDVFARVRPPADEKTGIYASDYAAVVPLKELADRHGIAVLVLHHTRKARAEDFLDTLSGTQGIAGAADSVLTMERSRGQADGKLNITGRDVEEASYAMRFDASRGMWTLLEGPALDYTLSDTRRRILAYLRLAPDKATRDIAEATKIGYETVKKTCQRMAKDGQLLTDGQGTYSVPRETLAVGVSHVSPESPALGAFYSPITNSVSLSTRDGDSGDSGDSLNEGESLPSGECWGCATQTQRRDDDGWPLCEVCDLNETPTSG